MANGPREAYFSEASALGWVEAGISGKGYVKMHCPCGAHKMWLAKTPSDPNYYKNKVAWLRRQPCAKDPKS